VRRLLQGTTLAVTIVSIPLLACISAMITHERRKDFAILRSIGAKKTYIMSLLFAESFSIAVIGGLIGIGSSAIILVFFKDFIASSLKIPFIIPSPLAILVNGITALILCTVIGGIASLYPAIQISRSDSYETIRKGES